MAFVVHHAGGKSINEQGVDLLEVKPSRIHAKEPVFIGSPLDIDELKEYLQQTQD
jgi:fructose-1,6-bisphosphatase I